MIRVNDGMPIDMGIHEYNLTKTIEVPLKKGNNNVTIWLSNKVGLTSGAWVFSFRAVTNNGIVLLPQL